MQDHKEYNKVTDIDRSLVRDSEENRPLVDTPAKNQSEDVLIKTQKSPRANNQNPIDVKDLDVKVDKPGQDAQNLGDHNQESEQANQQPDSIIDADGKKNGKVTVLNQNEAIESENVPKQTDNKTPLEKSAIDFEKITVETWDKDEMNEKFFKQYIQDEEAYEIDSDEEGIKPIKKKIFKKKGIFEHRWTHHMDLNNVQTKKIHMDTIGDVLYEMYESTCQTSEHSIKKKIKKRSFQEFKKLRKQIKKDKVFGIIRNEHDLKKKEISYKSKKPTFEKMFMLKNSNKNEMRTQMTSRKAFREKKDEINFMENKKKDEFKPAYLDDNELAAIDILEEKMQTQISESRLIHKKVLPTKVKNLYSIWGTVIASDGRCEEISHDRIEKEGSKKDGRIRFATHNALWNYEYRVDYTTQKKYESAETYEDLVKHGVGVNPSKASTKLITKEEKTISNLQTDGQSVIGNFKKCSFTTNKFFILTDQGMIQMWSNEGGPLIDIVSTLPKVDLPLKDTDEFPFEHQEVISFVAVNDNLLFFCTKKRIYKVYLPQKNKENWEKKVKLEDDFYKANHHVIDDKDEIIDEQKELANVQITQTCNDQKNHKQKILSDTQHAETWIKEVVCSYEMLEATEIDGFDIENDNMVVYNGQKDLDVFTNFSMLETDAWKSEPFFEDNFQGIILWKFFAGKLIIVTQDNTIQVYNFEKRSLEKKIKNPQEFGLSEELKKANWGHGFKVSTLIPNDDKKNLSFYELEKTKLSLLKGSRLGMDKPKLNPTRVKDSKYKDDKVEDVEQVKNDDTEQKPNSNGQDGTEDDAGYNPEAYIDLSKYFLHSKFAKNYQKEHPKIEISENSICHLLYIEVNKLDIKVKMLVLGYANGDVLIVNLDCKDLDCKDAKRYSIKTDSIIECIHFDEKMMTVFILNNTSNQLIVDIVNKLKYEKNLFKQDGKVLSTVCSANNKYLYMAGQNGILKQISQDDMAQSSDYGNVMQGTINVMATTSNNKYLFTADSKGEIKRFEIGARLDTKKVKVVKRKNPENELNPQLEKKDGLKAHDYEIKCIAVTEDCKDQFSIDKKGWLRQWKIDDLDFLHEWEVSENVTYSLCTSKNNKFQFTSDVAGYIKQIEIVTGNIVRTLTNTHEGEVYAIAISMDKYIFSTDSNGTLKQWNIDDGNLAKDYGKTHKNAIQVCECSRDDNYLFTADAQGTVMQYSIKHQGILRQLETPNSKSIQTCCVSYDSKNFVSCDIYGDINIFKIKTNSLVQNFATLHPGKTKCLHVSPNNRHVVSGDDEGNILEWDWKTGDYGFTSTDVLGKGNKNPIDYMKNITAITISYDGKYMFVGNLHGMIFIFKALKLDWELVGVKKAYDKEIVKIICFRDKVTDLKSQNVNEVRKILVCSPKKINIWKLKEVGEKEVGEKEVGKKEVGKKEGGQGYITLEKDGGNIIEENQKTGEEQNIQGEQSSNKELSNNGLPEYKADWDVCSGTSTSENIINFKCLILSPCEEFICASDDAGQVMIGSINFLKETDIKEKDTKEKDKKTTEGINYELIDPKFSVHKKKKEISAMVITNDSQNLFVGNHEGHIYQWSWKHCKDKYRSELPKPKDSDPQLEKKDSAEYNWKEKCLLKNYQNAHLDGQISSLTATPDSKFLFSTAYSKDSEENGSIFIWHIEQQKILYKLSNDVTNSGEIHHMVCSTKVMPRLDNLNLHNPNECNYPNQEKKNECNYETQDASNTNIDKGKHNCENERTNKIDNKKAKKFKKDKKIYLNSEDQNDNKNDLSQNKKWNKLDLLSNYRNELYLYFIDDSNCVKYICLNNFLSDNDFWEQGSDYQQPYSIKYFNLARNLNYMTSLILNKLENRETDIQRKFIADNNNEIMHRFKEVRIISDTDILVMFLVYMYLDFKMYIPRFLQTIVENKVHFRADMSLITGPMLICFDDSIGPKSIISCIEYMFLPIVHMKRGDRKLVDANVVASKDAVSTLNSEHLDMKTFHITEGDTPPIKVDIYKFNYPLDIEMPEQLFIQFLKKSHTYLKDDATALKNQKLDKLINYLWDESKEPMIHYQIISSIPFLILLAEGYVIRQNNLGALVQILSWIRLVFIPFFQFAEIEKCRAYGSTTYFQTPLTYVDIPAIIMHYVSAVLTILEPKINTLNTTVYAYTLLIVTFKLNFDLDALDFMRQLTASIREVIKDITAFGVMFFFFLFAFTQIFYFTKFFVTQKNGQEWHWYLLYTFNAFFANWEYSTPAKPELIWTQFIFMFFTFLFPIIMFNILISMVCSSHSNMENNMLNEDNKRILLLTRQCIEIKKLIAPPLDWCKRHLGFKEESQGKSYIYVCIERLDQEVVDDSVIEAQIMEKVKKLPEIKLQVDRIGTLTSKVFKLSQKVDIALTQMNGFKKKAQKEIEDAEGNLRKQKEEYLNEKLTEQKKILADLEAVEVTKKRRQRVKGGFEITAETNKQNDNAENVNLSFLEFMKYSNMFIKHCDYDADSSKLDELEDNMTQFAEECRQKIEEREQQIATLAHNVRIKKKDAK